MYNALYIYEDNKTLLASSLILALSVFPVVYIVSPGFPAMRTPQIVLSHFLACNQRGCLSHVIFDLGMGYDLCERVSLPGIVSY